MKDLNNITLVIPSYEPDEKLITVLKQAAENGFSDIVVVNDGSGEEYDGIFKTVKSLDGVTLLCHETNCGKGTALKTAFSYILENRPESKGVITADGDGQHLIGDMIKCVEKMFSEDKAVLGCRDFSQPQVPERSRKGNNVSCFVFDKFFHMKISDTQTGLRAIPIKYLPGLLSVDGERYEYENNMLLYFRDENVPYCEQVIETVYIEENKSSHFRPVADSVRIYYRLLEKPLKYITSSLGCTITENIIQMLLHDFLQFVPTGGFASVLAEEVLDFLPARILSSVLNYYLNKKFVFKDKNKNSLRRYFALWIGQMSVTAVLTATLEYAFGGTEGVVYFLLVTAVKCLIFFFSYNIQKKWVFAKK